MYEIVTKAKVFLEEDTNNVVFGQINKGNSQIIQRGKLYSLLRQADGMRCGSIDIWNYKILGTKQYILSIEESGNNFLCIGQVDYVPLILNRANDIVYILYQEIETNERLKRVSDFDSFITKYLFGICYKEIVRDCQNDRWFQFVLRKLL